MSESEEQIKLFQWAELQKCKYPQLAMLYHIPNGGHRNVVTAARLKREGVKSGVPDICLPIPNKTHTGLYIELKAGKGKPTQKSIHVIRNLIEIFTDVGDVVIDPCAGSGVTLLAAEMLGRKSYGFEIKKEYVQAFNEKLSANVQTTIFNHEADRRKLEMQQLNFMGGTA